MLKQAKIQVAMPWPIDGDVAACVAEAVLPLDSIRVGNERDGRERTRIVPVTVVSGPQATKLLEGRDQIDSLMVTR